MALMKIYAKHFNQEEQDAAIETCSLLSKIINKHKGACLCVLCASYLNLSLVWRKTPSSHLATEVQDKSPCRKE